MDKMDKAIRDKWIDGLRLGKYEQTRGALFDFRKESYCCLGVLCEVDKTLPTLVQNYECDPYYKRVDELLGCDNDPTKALRNKFYALNDDERKSFVEIADWIEANL